MFKKNKSTAPKRKKSIKQQLATTGLLTAGMVGLYILGKREDRKLKKMFEDLQDA